jgi:hypothetical protein
LEIGISILGLVVVVLFSVKLNYFDGFKSVKLLFAAAFVSLSGYRQRHNHDPGTPGVITMYPSTHGLCQSLFEPGKDEEANIWGKGQKAISWRKGPVESDPGLRTKNSNHLRHRYYFWSMILCPSQMT